MRFGRGGRGRWRIRRVPLGVLAAVLVALVVWTVHEARKPGPWQRVFATREGLTGGRLATGGIIRPGDRFVFCSDGLNTMVADDEIARWGLAGSPSVAAWNLVELANQYGGKDNVTVLVLEVADVVPWHAVASDGTLA